MRLTLLERRKHLAAWILSAVAWVGTIFNWVEGSMAGTLPWHSGAEHPITVSTLLFLLAGLCAVVCALPDDREDVDDLKLWTFLLWCGLPLLLLGFLVINPLRWFS